MRPHDFDFKALLAPTGIHLTFLVPAIGDGDRRVPTESW